MGRGDTVLITSGLRMNLGDQAIRLGCLKMLRDSGIWPLAAELTPYLGIRHGLRLLCHLVAGSTVLYSVGHPIQDVTSGIYTPAALSGLTLTRLFRRRHIVISAGASELRRGWVRRIARFSLTRALFLSARDEFSAQRLRELTGRDDVYVGVDPALALTPEDLCPGESVSPVADGSPYVCIAPRRWDAYDSSGRSRQIDLTDTLVQLTERLVTELGVSVVFVSMCQISARHPGQDDHTFASEICARLSPEVASRVTVLSAETPVSGLAGVLRSAEATLAVRMHASILSAAMGTPPINIHYSEKGRSFMEMLGMGSRAVSIGEFTPDSMLGMVGEILGNRERIAEQLCEGVERLRERLRQQFQEIAAALRGKG
ncbi:polysaccharide pyruvyl transferase family protein [Candidatus Sumerlaeota bacterium]|nr:polysaccharide pyruvyl transferase family protein [Candidatus Sumerlaeota bacterium]